MTEEEFLADDVLKIVKKAEAKLIGREASLNTIRAGRYNGRVGKIVNVIPDAQYGLVYLVYIYKSGMKIPLNSSVRATRSYWQIYSLELL